MRNGKAFGTGSWILGCLCCMGLSASAFADLLGVTITNSQHVDPSDPADWAGAGQINIGTSGDATVHVAQGTTVTTNAELHIGTDPSYAGTVNLDGRWLGQLPVYVETLGTLNITSTGEVNNMVFVRGSLTNAGRTTDDMWILSTGTLAGGTRTTPGIVMGYLTVFGTLHGSQFISGKFTMESGSTLRINTGTNAYDQITVGLSTSLGGTLDLVPGVMAQGDVYTLIHSAQGFSGTFDGVTVNGTAATPDASGVFSDGSNTYQLATSGNDLTLTALTVVPEPMAIGTMLGGSSLLLVRRRSRKA